jgi:hypothetical protein
MEIIIGREEEKTILGAALYSNEAELIAIYGRRRIGKTYLVRNYFYGNLVFEMTGLHNASLREQLANFSSSLQTAMGMAVPPAPPSNWMDAFQKLDNFLISLPKKKPIVVLFDEMPWLSTPKSGFLQAFGYWWNTRASRIPHLKVVICGSAASWMIKKVFNDRGGLHNRVTHRIRLLPFRLKETEQFLQHHGVKLDRYQVMQLYMAMGGIPHYLKQVKKGESATQNIDKLCFAKNGFLRTEFKDLYHSLFANAGNHEAIVRALSKKPGGMTRPEIIKACGFTTGGWITEVFDELEQSGFISQHIPYDRRVRDAIFKLTDEYSLFYLKFIEDSRASGAGTWLRLSGSASYTSWCGFAFESVCQKHVSKIKHALGISGVYTEHSAWRYHPKKGEKGVQIDLLLDRADYCINLCEIKFSTTEFVIDKKYATEIDKKVQVFKQHMKIKKTVFPTMITTYGVKQNIHSTGRIVNEVVMDELF